MVGDRVAVELSDDRHVGRLGPLLQMLTDAVSAEFPAGFALAVSDPERTLVAAHGGWACLVAERVAVERPTLFDLASLTKVVAATTLALALEERGAWSLDQPVASWVPEFRGMGTT